MPNVMARRKLRHFKGRSSVVEKDASQKEMKQQKKCDLFSLAGIALVVAICVAPLTAELSVCKYSDK